MVQLQKQKIKAVLQLGAMDCAPANLKAISEAFGHQYEIGFLRDLCGTCRAGTNLSGLQEAAEELGFDVALEIMDLEDLRDLGGALPLTVVALRRSGTGHHFVTIESISGDQVTIMDPTFGLDTIPFYDFRDQMLRKPVPVDPEQVILEGKNRESKKSVLNQLMCNGVEKNEAIELLDKHGIIFTDDCIKYMNRLKSVLGNSSKSLRSVILASLFASDSFRLPELHNSIGDHQQKGQKIDRICRPLVLSFRALNHPGPKSSKSVTERPRLGLFQLLWANRKTWVPLTFLGVVLSIVGAIIPLFAGAVIEGISSGWPPLLVLFICAGVSRLFTMYFSFSFSIGSGWLSLRHSIRLKSGLLAKWPRLPILFFEDRQPGEVLSRIEEGDTLATFLSSWPVALIMSFLSLFVASGMLWFGFKPFFWLLLLSLVLQTMVTEVFSKRLRRLSRDILESKASFNRTVIEIFRGRDTFYLTSSENMACKDVDSNVIKSILAQFRFTDWDILRNSVGGGVSACISLLILIVAFGALFSGESSPARIIIALGYVALLRTAVGGVLGARQAFEHASMALDRYKEYYSAAENNVFTCPFDLDVLSCEKVWSELVLQGIGHRYSRQQYIVKGVCFSIMPGDHIGLVGKSGAGKSTLLKIISGLIRPKEGSIFCDGEVLRYEDLHSWGVRIVDQEATVFRGTLLENVTDSLNGVVDKRILRACCVAGLHGMIKGHKDGWLRLIDGRRGGLSGGEIRRMCLARVLLDEPKIVLLDETLCSVSWRMRKKILNRAKKYYPKTTIILTTHDHTDIQLLDKKLTIENGKIECVQ